MVYFLLWNRLTPAARLQDVWLHYYTTSVIITWYHVAPCWWNFIFRSNDPQSSAFHWRYQKWRVFVYIKGKWLLSKAPTLFEYVMPLFEEEMPVCLQILVIKKFHKLIKFQYVNMLVNGNSYKLIVQIDLIVLLKVWLGEFSWSNLMVSRKFSLNYIGSYKKIVVVVKP